MSNNKTRVSIFWHRRDLRLEDNAGAYHALRSGHPVLPFFIFDKNILDQLADRDDARVSFIHQELWRLRQELAAMGSALLVKYGEPETVWKEVLEAYDVQAVYTNHDYEPYAIARDEKVRTLLASRQIQLHTYKDHVIFEGLEVAKKGGGSYTVFTPYSKAWRVRLQSRTGANGESYYLQSYSNQQYHDAYLKIDPLPLLSLEEMNFSKTSLSFPPQHVAQGLIRNYDQTRNFPALAGTSRLGVHFRFGTISIREKARKAQRLNDTFLNELIWRDFYAQILANFPWVAERSFREKYDQIEWLNDERAFQAWCAGRTGYPIVDAGMRELNATGYMHNRVRMITASFLTKHLLIDWRWGEAYFARRLLDYDLASNNGGWQWAAGSGTDAAPYFRIFNPYSQQEKFDKDWKYIKTWVPEVNTSKYPGPIVDHKAARLRCLETYKAALNP